MVINNTVFLEQNIQEGLNNQGEPSNTLTDISVRNDRAQITQEIENTEKSINTHNFDQSLKEKKEKLLVKKRKYKNIEVAKNIKACRLKKRQQNLARLKEQEVKFKKKKSEGLKKEQYKEEKEKIVDQYSIITSEKTVNTLSPIIITSEITENEVSEITPEYVYNELSLFFNDCIGYIKKSCETCYKRKFKNESLLNFVEEEFDDCNDKAVVSVDEHLPADIMQINEKETEKLNKDNEQHCSYTLIIENITVDKSVVEKKVRLVKTKSSACYSTISYSIREDKEDSNIDKKEANIYILKEVNDFYEKCSALNYHICCQKKNNKSVIYIYFNYF